MNRSGYEAMDDAEILERTLAGDAAAIQEFFPRLMNTVKGREKVTRALTVFLRDKAETIRSVARGLLDDALAGDVQAANIIFDGVFAREAACRSFAQGNWRPNEVTAVIAKVGELADAGDRRAQRVFRRLGRTMERIEGE